MRRDPRHAPGAIQGVHKWRDPKAARTEQPYSLARRSLWPSGHFLCADGLVEGFMKRLCEFRGRAMQFQASVWKGLVSASLSACERFEVRPEDGFGSAASSCFVAMNCCRRAAIRTSEKKVIAVLKRQYSEGHRECLLVPLHLTECAGLGGTPSFHSKKRIRGRGLHGSGQSRPERSFLERGGSWPGRLHCPDAVFRRRGNASTWLCLPYLREAEVASRAARNSLSCDQLGQSRPFARRLPTL
ncbi:hypothetical protein EDF57_102556 [Novosphingobium sp. PhB55]|nr:hypothetical protein EDF57_102556 [Novosphingobium sp. PhB55]